MNAVEIIGGTKFEKKVALTAVQFCLKTLLPRYRTLDITVRLRNIKTDAIGYCMMLDHDREFEIEIQKGMKLKDFVSTICHEMVHVKQYAKHEMNEELTDSGRAKWKGSFIKAGTKYYDLPWEKEAYRLQDKLADEIWENNLI